MFARKTSQATPLISAQWVCRSSAPRMKVEALPTRAITHPRLASDGQLTRLRHRATSSVACFWTVRVFGSAKVYSSKAMLRPH